MATPTLTVKRFHIFVESDLINLQNERCMFELNDQTSLKEFKERVIARNDELSVVRTYIEQLKIEYRDEEIPEYPLDSGITVYEALHLNEEILSETRNVVKIKVFKHANVNGTGGILSRDFWRDVRSDGRLQFLPQQDQQQEQMDTPEVTIPVEESVSESIQPPDLRSPNIAHIEPTKIAVHGGRVWEMEGTTYETLIEPNTGEKKLVAQEDLTSSEYILTLELDGVIKKATLNTSECIVVDNGIHNPYLLLSPLGTAKLNSVFKLSSGESLMQKVQIMMYTPPTPTQPPPPQQQQQQQQQEQAEGQAQQQNDDLQRRIVDIGTRFGVNAFKLGVVLYLLGVRPNQHLMQHWFKYLVLFIILFNSYVMFFTGENRVIRFHGDFSFIGRITDAAVKRVVRRTTDLELITLNDPNWLKMLKWNMENIFKDIVMSVMSIVPWLLDKIYVEAQIADHDTEEYENIISLLDADVNANSNSDINTNATTNADTNEVNDNN